MRYKFSDLYYDDTKNAKKLKSSEYKNIGKYIIVDQGKSLIAGYTDNEDGLYTDVPVIIFGDHTRNIKYINSPFFLGADGTKVLKSSLKNVNYKYLYYLLKNANIPDTGYNRHYKWLKELMFKYHSQDQQNQIVTILDKLDLTISKYREELLLLDELVKARFVEMFGKYEASVKLSRYIKELRAGKSLAGKTKCKNKVLKTGAATFGFFDKEQYKYYPVEYVPNPLHKVEDGDVIISRMNTPELVGSCSYVFEAPDDMYYPDRLWKTIITEDTNPIFLWQLMWQQDIRKQIKENSFGTSGTMNNISKVKLLNIKAIDVPLELQNQFASFVQEIDKSRSRIQKSLEASQELFDSLMQEYFG